MYKTIQETTFGQLVYLASGRRLFSYPQDQPGYQAPQKYLPGHQVQQTEEEKPQRPAPASRTQSTQTTQTGPFLTPPETPSAETDLSQGPPARQYSDDATLAEEGQAGHKSGKASPRYERSQSQNSWQGEKKEEQYPWEVKWEDNDPDLPLHWSVPKKCFVTFCICALTFGVYAGSSIVTPSIENIMTTFGVGQPVAGLSLTLFVFGYGTGPLVLSPLSEIPQIGRNLPTSSPWPSSSPSRCLTFSPPQQPASSSADSWRVSSAHPPWRREARRSVICSDPRPALSPLASGVSRQCAALRSGH